VSPLRQAPTRTHAHYLRASLGERGFRRLLLVRILGQVGDGFFQGGLAGSVLFNPERAANGMAITAGFAALLLPYSLIGPYLGVFLDRWSRRSIIFVANFLRALLVVPVALFIWWGNESPVLFGLALLIIGLNRFFLAGIAAATPHVVEDHMLVTANSVAATVGSIVFSFGLGAGAVMVKTLLDTSFHGYAAVTVTAAGWYLASALFGRVSFDADTLGPNAGTRRSDSIANAVREVGRGTAAGLRHLADRRGAAYAMLAQAAHRCLYGILLLSVLLLYRTRFNHGSDVTGSFSGIGQAFGAGGAGLLLAAFVTPPIARRIGGWRWVTALLALAGTAIVAFGLPFRPMFLLGAVFAVSLAGQGIKIVVDTSLQHECDDLYRGRVFSVNDTAFNLFMVGGMYIGALALPVDGRSPATLGAIAIVYLIAAAVYAAFAGRWARRVGDDIALPDSPAHSHRSQLVTRRG
jgi:Major Facilitator Superfamily